MEGEKHKTVLQVRHCLGEAVGRIGTLDILRRGGHLERGKSYRKEVTRDSKGGCFIILLCLVSSDGLF